jgi:plastocyanin
MGFIRYNRAVKGMRALGALAVIAGLSAAIMAGDITGKVSGLRSAANVVVYIDAAGPAPGGHAVIDQKKMTFIPHVMVVAKGTTVDFLNSDAVGHNVYWPSVGGNKGLANNLGTWPQGVKKSFTFNNPGVVPLLCNVHAEMAGFIFVAPGPYYAVTNGAGDFVIKGVPAGHYTIKTWSEGGRPIVQQVDVGGGNTTVNLTAGR